ncbi:hypothetical protein M422DRAFT_39566 [Sphaerobolus stellatus SS14]|uniref:Unplaced genomic scaffold SPHSTscaffold_567, whole genome shotgun sequence n=1 Tax=Sphaerobolus stellatus (strain SS14) TaxID=990650 RepID=A0A0C9UDM8_SPHS4|nr:hypothetical protein M422DRAFT_39566 [Sphaerobolus stellatus SS14]
MRNKVPWSEAAGGNIFRTSCRGRGRGTNENIDILVYRSILGAVVPNGEIPIMCRCSSSLGFCPKADPKTTAAGWNEAE